MASNSINKSCKRDSSDSKSQNREDGKVIMKIVKKSAAMARRRSITQENPLVDGAAEDDYGCNISNPVSRHSSSTSPDKRLKITPKPILFNDQKKVSLDNHLYDSLNKEPTAAKQTKLPKVKDRATLFKI